MKNLVLLFILLSADKQCTNQGQIPLIRATSQTWSGGAAAMRGTYYHIYIGLQMSPDYKFDSLWVNNHRVAVEVMRGSAPADSMELYANDKMGIRIPGSDSDPSASPEAKFPIASSAEGLLGYYYKGVRKYFPINSFIRLKPVAYQ